MRKERGLSPLGRDTSNEAGVALADRYAMRPIFATARMYSKAIPDLPVHGIFGVTSFELG